MRSWKRTRFREKKCLRFFLSMLMCVSVAGGTTGQIYAMNGEANTNQKEQWYGKDDCGEQEKDWKNNEIITDQVKGQLEVSFEPVGKEVSLMDVVRGDTEESVTRESLKKEEWDEHSRYIYNGEVNVVIRVRKDAVQINNLDLSVIGDGEKLTNQEQWGKAHISDWSQVENEWYQCGVHLTEDGDYQIRLYKKDATPSESEQEGQDESVMMEKTEEVIYTSGMITIDTTCPRISVSYDNNDCCNEIYYKEKRTAEILITDRNFRPSEVEAGVNVTDVSLQEHAVDYELPDLTRWKNENDQSPIWELVDKEAGTWRTYLDFFTDGRYHFTVQYRDLAGFSLENTYDAEFVIDQTAPNVNNMKLAYSDSINWKGANSWQEGVKNVFAYRDQMVVTLTAEDDISGIASMTWTYFRDDLASDSNVSVKTETIFAERIQYSEDHKKAMAFFTLEAGQEGETKGQYRGTISFTATDFAGNVSGVKKDDKRVNIVDHISPTRRVFYSPAVQVVDEETFLTRGYFDSAAENTKSILYYDKDVEITFQIEEINFYAQDVSICVNGEERTPSIWQRSGDVWTGKMNLSEDGEYVITMDYTDRSENQMKHYQSERIVIDQKDPVVEMKYINSGEYQEIDGRKYYYEPQTVVIQITEHNFRADDVSVVLNALDVTGQPLPVEDYAAYLSNRDHWVRNGDTYTAEITFSCEANYMFEIQYRDLAGRKADIDSPDYFTIDGTAPRNLKITYENSILDKVLHGLTFGFYKTGVKVTVQAEDSVSGIAYFQYQYEKSKDAGSVNVDQINGIIKADSIVRKGKEFIASFYLPEEEWKGSRQICGTVGLLACDYCGNQWKTQDMKQIVVDSIAPVGNVEYRTPVQECEGIYYFDQPIEARVEIEETNFYEEDLEVVVTKDGQSYPVDMRWLNSSQDRHSGVFFLREDGDYFITISCRDKSGNAMAQYHSKQMTIDTILQMPQITVNGEAADGKAFSDRVNLMVQFEDRNFDSYDIELLRTRYGNRKEDVTEQFIQDQVKLTEQGGKGECDDIQHLPEMDGIYTMTLCVKDKAGHIQVNVSTFTVNRFGSVYEYSEYLCSLIENGGAYVQEIEEDLIITEYNSDRLIAGSSKVEISCDGKPLNSILWDLSCEPDNAESLGKCEWYRYEYKLQKDNFKKDGIYKIYVSSADAAGNFPEISNFEEKSIMFHVDSSCPEINNICGLEKSIIDAEKVEVSYSVYDAMSLESIEIIIDEKVIEHITDFQGDHNRYQGTFQVNEKPELQHIRIKVTDRAGNITDTDSRDFHSAYSFCPSVWVSGRSAPVIHEEKRKMLLSGELISMGFLGAIIVFSVLFLGKKAYEKKKMQS